nr:MAG TPA: hypothetical protein [Caudoviricetes sp.]
MKRRRNEPTTVGFYPPPLTCSPLISTPRC